MTEELQTIMPLVNEIVDTMLQLEKVGIMADNFEKCELRMYLDDMMTYYPDNYVDTELNSMILTRMYEYYNDKADELYEKLESSLDDEERLKIILAVSKHCDWAEFCEEDFSPEELEIFLAHRDMNTAISYANSFLASMELKEEKTDENKYKSICI